MYQLIGFIQRFALSKGGSTVVGLITVCTLIWFMGPTLGLKSSSTRLTIIAAIFGLALIWYVVSRFIINRRTDKFASDMAGQDDKAAQREAELDDIKDKMSEVISSLKSSELGFKYKGKAALYALPWYMVIGPSAAGKSTMLRNSGLHFPYNRQEDLDIKGFGGTRNCDWWFSDDAVLLDTAGRYTSDSDDNEEWVAFLKLLKRYRKKTPINGVLVALSIADILTQDGLALETHVNIIRERIEELIKYLGINFPVYIVFTKCDLLYGFNAFFHEGNDEDLEQIWGAYLLDNNLNQNNIDETVGKRLEELYTRLCNMRILKLSLERNFDKKAEILDFPEQFRYAGEKLQEFIKLLFKENPYQDNPKFYGFYFTSGAQKGAPIQRIVGDLQESFGYVDTGVAEENDSYATQTSKSYFIHRLFKDVIFKSKSDVYKNKQQFKFANWLKMAWVSSALLVVIVSFLLLSGSLTTNTLLLGKGSDVTSTLTKELNTPKLNSHLIYLGLNKVFMQYVDITRYESDLPLHLRLGIYRADQQKKPLRKIIFDAIEFSLLKRIIKVLEDHISTVTGQWDNLSDKDKAKHQVKLYEYLRTYMMLVFRDWVDVEQSAPVFAKLWIQEINRHIANDTEKLRAKEEIEITKMVAMYLTSLKGHEFTRRIKLNIDSDLVAQARLRLKLNPTAKNLYARIKGQASFKYKDLYLNNLLKKNKDEVLKSDMRLPGMFTAVGWKDFVHPQIKKIVIIAYQGDWVLDADVEDFLMAGKKPEITKETIDQSKTRTLHLAIRKLYFKDYAEFWLKFVKSINIKPFISMEDAADKYAILTAKDGPLIEFISLIATNINLTDYDIEQPLANSRLAKLTSKPVVPTKASVPTIQGKPSMSDKSASVATYKRYTVKELEEDLKDLQRIVSGGKKQSKMFSTYINALAAIQGDLEELAASSNIGRDSQNYASSILAGSSNKVTLYKAWVSTNKTLKRVSFQTRESMKSLLNAPLKNAWRVILHETRRKIESGWNQKVAAIFRSRLKGRFPFKSGGSDSSLRDVTRFFKPGDGVYWSYFHKQLKPFLVKSGGRWRSSLWLGIGIDLTKKFESSIRLAESITKTLFVHSKSKIGIEFYLNPIPTSGIQQVILETNGQQYEYRNYPGEWRKFHWPGSGAHPGARLLAVSNNNHYRFEIKKDGVWGLFHLLGKARVTKMKGLTYLSIWRLNAAGNRMIVKFRVKASTHHNMFNRRKFKVFQVPGKIFYGNRSASYKSSSLD